jgi:2,3-bisphosphoglycerate-independent phosphoglycerate mutase
MAIRCNIISLADGKIKNHHGGHLTTSDGDILIRHLDQHLGSERVRFITGIQYRHLLVVRGGNKHITCSPPHDHPDEPWHPLLVKGDAEAPCEAGRLTSLETASLLNDLILRSQELLSAHPLNQARRASGHDEANSIWPWSPGYRPSMDPISTIYPEVKSGSVISAVDLIKGIGHYAGLKIVEVEGATGLYDTNYEGKASAAIEALRHDDFVFLHLEASDEAGHDGNLELKMRTIEYLDHRIVEPIYNEVKTWEEPVCIAILPDHLTPVETRTHVKGPVPFVIWHRDTTPDSVTLYDEVSAVGGSYGLLRPEQFMQVLMRG